jgi:hypothetical protein
MATDRVAFVESSHERADGGDCFPAEPTVLALVAWGRQEGGVGGRPVLGDVGESLAEQGESFADLGMPGHWACGGSDTG